MAGETAADTLPVLHIDLAGQGGQTAGCESVAVETPVNIVYGTLPYAVMMATPADLEDFVTGFSLTEGIIGAAEDIRGMAVRSQAGGLVVDVELVPERMRAHLALSRRRNLTGRTSCGLCGIESLGELPCVSRPKCGRPRLPARLPTLTQRKASSASPARCMQPPGANRMGGS